MDMNKIMSIDLYNRDVMVHFGSRKELRKELLNYHHKPRIVEEIIESINFDAVCHKSNIFGETKKKNTPECALRWRLATCRDALKCLLCIIQPPRRMNFFAIRKDSDLF